MPIHEAALWAAYLDTRYVAFVGDDEIELRVGHRSPALDALLADAGLSTWCFVTAWNPGSEPLADAENRARNAALRASLEAEGRVFHDGEGRGARGDWPPEESFLVLGLSRSDAIALAQRHGQNAVVLGRLGAPAELVDCRTRADRVEHAVRGDA